MLVRERQGLILRAVQSGAVSVRDLSDQLQVSESTVRRDLDQLARSGAITRTYGGALPLEGAESRTTDDGREETSFHDAPQATDSQLRVARAAAALVTDGSVVMLDIGRTAQLLAAELRGRDVTIITSSLAVLDVVRDDPAVRLVLTGGVLRRNYQTMVGSLAAAAFNQLSADTVFLSCTGVRPHGHVVDNMAVEAPLKQAMIAAADQVVLLATAEKFPGTGALRLCSLAEVDVVVTTAGPEHDQTLDICREAGGKVITA